MIMSKTSRKYQSVKQDWKVCNSRILREKRVMVENQNKQPVGP